MDLVDQIRDALPKPRRKSRKPSNGLLIQELLGPEDGPYDFPPVDWRNHDED